MIPNLQSEFDDLSKRELDVLKHLAAGDSREEIAKHLNISVLTYDGYRKSIRQKLRIKNQRDWRLILERFEHRLDRI